MKLVRYDKLFKYDIDFGYNQGNKHHYIDVDVYYGDFKFANIDGLINDCDVDNFMKDIIKGGFVIEILDRYLDELGFYYCGIYE